MYWQNQDENDATLKKDIIDFFKKYMRKDAFVVASSHSDFTDGDGDNPPHKKARNRYEELVAAGHFICTHEYPNKKGPMPLVFTVDDKGVQIDDARKKAKEASILAAAVTAARGGSQPPGTQVGFGHIE
jgi:hypothetical protein